MVAQVADEGGRPRNRLGFGLDWLGNGGRRFSER